MIGKRISMFAASVTLAALIGCTSDQESSETDTEILTQPGTETVEMEVPTTDTLVVERTTTVDVDTTRIEGGAADDTL